MVKNFETIEECIVTGILLAHLDHWSLARFTRRLYLLERQTGINKLLLEQIALEEMVDMRITLG